MLLLYCNIELCVLEYQYKLKRGIRGLTITLSLVIFAALVVLFQIIAEVFTILFMMTGLSERTARFQVVSLLTTAGYTTRESESIIENNRRRSLAKIIMVFGYCFSAIIVSIFVNVLMNIGQNESSSDEFWIWSATAIGIMIVVILLFRVRFFRKYIDRFIFKISGKLMFGKYENYVIIINDCGDNCIAEVKMRKVPEAFRGRTLQELKINADYGLLVLAIRRGKKTIDSVGKDQIFQEGDLITVYGRLKVIKDAFAVKTNKKDNFDVTEYGGN